MKTIAKLLASSFFFSSLAYAVNYEDLPGIEAEKQDYENIKQALEESFNGGPRNLNDRNGLIIAKSIVLAESNPDGVIFGYLDAILKETMTRIKGTEYAKSYDDNEVRADEKYRGERLLVKGYITDIGKDVFGSPYLALNGAGNFQKTMAMFNSNEENISYLSEVEKRSIVDLVCIGSGLSVSQAMLRDCIPYSRYHDDIAESVTFPVLKNHNDVVEIAAFFFLSRKGDNLDGIYSPYMYNYMAAMAPKEEVTCDSPSIECFEKFDEWFSSQDDPLNQTLREKIFSRFDIDALKQLN